MRTVRARLDRYILSEILGPLGLGFLVYTFILLLRFLFQSAEMIIRRGLPLSVVGELLVLTLPNIVVLTLPMSLLFGILIAVGRLSSDSELIAMRSSGISLLTLYRPILLLSAFFTVINTLLMIYALPWGNHSLQQLKLEIATQSVAQQVQPRVFYEEWPGKVVYVFEVPPGEDRWKGVFLAESIPTSGDNQVTIADWGEVRVDPAGEQVILRLYNAIRHKVDLDAPDRYEISRHKRLDLVLDDQFTTVQKAKISVSKSIRELTLDELEGVREDPTASDEQRNLALVEIHKKFSIPMACMVFGLFALPLGINNRRGGKASGFALSILVIVVYYVLLSNGEEAARFGKLPAWLGMWAPNLLLAVAGIFLLARRNRDKSLLISRVDRWVREDVWGGLLFLKGLGREARRERRQRQERRIRPARPRQPRMVFLLPRLRLAFPNILDRYVVRLFSMVFLLVALSGLSLHVVFDLSETIDEILKNKVPNGVVFDYYKYISLQMFY
ncbi:LPS export ABC transporter permease LptF, partial [bacterium]